MTYLITICLGVLVMMAGWLALRASEHDRMPRWLGGLLILAAVLRLGVGVLWYVALPTLGHNSPAEQAGYVMADAQARDQAAWKLAQSERSLWSAFRNNRAVDQYGGMLFLSALVYRYLGGATHQPLQMLYFSAVISALAIPLVYAFARRAWEVGGQDPPKRQSVARLAAWGLALYPEAVLMGSSQMREAFMIPLAMAAFYGLARYRQQRRWPSLAWMLIPILLSLPISPPFAALLAVSLLLAALLMGRQFFESQEHRDAEELRPASRLHDRQHRYRFWLVLAAAIGVALLAAWLALAQFAPDKATQPVALLQWWVQKSADWQAHLSEHASGKIQALFDRTPAWSHAPLLVGYGVVQPFLPAALTVVSDAPIWQWIAIWRAIGWTLLLPLLVYAPFRARKLDPSGWALALSAVVWLGILIASFRGGGDQWDNPRYRAAFAGLQVALAAWVWIAQRRAADPTFYRALIGLSLAFAWFIPWYLQRQLHIPWPVTDLFKTLGLGLASAVLFYLWDWARHKKQSARSDDPPS